MKKIISALLIFTLTFAICGCEPKATEKPEETVTPVETLDITDLSEYTIVYPATYSEWKMQEVNFLKSVLSTVTKAEIKAIPDSEEATGKEIILASSTRATKYAEKIASFDNAMCYVVGFDKDNIVLGGLNFYSDMRAIYDFVNNTLNYDDINDVYGTPLTKLEAKEVLWSEPDLLIMGTSMSALAPYTAWQVKDFVDCNFNLVFIEYNMFSRAQKDGISSTFRDVMKLYARFGIQCVFRPYIKNDTLRAKIPDEEDIIENPAMWGLYVRDEPELTEEMYSSLAQTIDLAIESYKQYGWKFYVNFIGYVAPDMYDIIDARKSYYLDYLSKADGISVDMYYDNYENRTAYFVYGYEFAKKLALETNQEFYSYTEAYNIKNRDYNTTKSFRTAAYSAFCFDVDMIEYFQYSDASPYYTAEGDWSLGSLVNYDFSKNSYWYDAQKVNAELIKINDLLKGFDYVGANGFASDKEDCVSLLEDPYSIGALLYLSIKENKYDASGVYGMYQNTETKQKAVVLTCLDELDQLNYDTSNNIVIETDGDRTYETRYTKNGETVTDWFTNKILSIKFNGTNLKCYKDGELFELVQSEDGIYTVPFDNGACYVFVFDTDK